ncbi:MAG: divalent-cation tolerance protein CutA [Planctomycetes bacterium]|nr:divalent-cation tolerance protein CutA [Planctomycetota bacterium]
MGGVRVILCTVPTDAAERIAGAIVEQRLAACANIVPGLLSIYWWKGEVQRDPEKLLVIKTTAERTQALIDGIRAIHPYEVPEIIAMDVVAGFPPYLAWVEESVRADGG